MIVKEVQARSIKDSRNENTIEISVNGSVASSPSGKSTGIHETPSYYKSLKWNIDFINKNKWNLKINNFDDLILVEKEIKKKAKLKDVKEFGANALFAFESAILKALANEQKKELWQIVNPKARKFPIPVGNAVGGGLHSSRFKKHPIFQEFLLIPREKSFSANVDSMKEVYVSIGRMLNAKNVNDEGAWHAAVDDDAVLDALSRFNSSTLIGVDFASSSFYKKHLYDYGKKEMTRPAHIEHIKFMIKNYGIFYCEDVCNEEDFIGFAEIKKEFSDSLIVGDDLTATHLERIKEARRVKGINAVIVKPNQNGSLLEVAEIMKYCKKHKMKTIISHRSGETMDDALADYAFAFGADYIKCGIATKWREAKLERMCEIEKNLNNARR